jgi:hypothetical protein
MKEKEPPKVHLPPSGPFNNAALKWTDSRGKRECYIPTDRVGDFIAGEELAASTTFHRQHRTGPRVTSGNERRMCSNSIIETVVWNCSYGPEDHRNLAGPHSLTQDPEPGKRRGCKVESNMSCKRGCTMHFTVAQLALWPHISRISSTSFRHESKTGEVVHGPEYQVVHGPASQIVHGQACAKESKHQLAPRLSKEKKQWVLHLLHLGMSVGQIMDQHLTQIEAGRCSRDEFLNEKDVRNLAREVAACEYMYDPDDAQSLHLHEVR